MRGAGVDGEDLDRVVGLPRDAHHALLGRGKRELRVVPVRFERGSWRAGDDRGYRLCQALRRRHRIERLAHRRERDRHRGERRDEEHDAGVDAGHVMQVEEERRAREVRTEREAALPRHAGRGPPDDDAADHEDHEHGERDAAVEDLARVPVDEPEAVQLLGESEETAPLVLHAEHAPVARIDVDLLAVEEAHLRGLGAGADAHVVELALGMEEHRVRHHRIERDARGAVRGREERRRCERLELRPHDDDRGRDREHQEHQPDGHPRPAVHHQHGLAQSRAHAAPPGAAARAGRATSQARTACRSSGPASRGRCEVWWIP